MMRTLPDRPPGQVRFLFQPSEEASDDENKSGGLRMTEEGVMVDVDAVIALHFDWNDPCWQCRECDPHPSDAHWDNA
jgi:metal-dependent amidase/aminoacylase/carboxypeptidase family protein